MIFLNLFRIVSEKIWGIVKTTSLYQIPGYKTLELVVESEPIFISDYYDPCLTSIPENSNPILTEERTYSRVREQPPTRVLVQNMDEDKEHKEWHLDVEDDDIHDATNINMDEIEDEIDAQEIVKEW
jgi:hypothetical protein